MSAMRVAEGRPLRRAARKLGRVIRRVVDAFRELNYWEHRAAMLTLAPDQYANEPDRAPDTYEEFLARCSGPLMCEPSSRARLAGRPVG
jgi:hypothetical protein